MQISKSLPALALAALCASQPAVQAADNPAQAAARQALAKKLFEASTPDATNQPVTTVKPAITNKTAVVVKSAVTNPPAGFAKKAEPVKPPVVTQTTVAVKTVVTNQPVVVVKP